METLKGIFPPPSQPPHKRDFLRENVQRIRKMQRPRKPSNQTEYSNRYNKQVKTRKFSLSENNAPAVHRSTHSLALSSSKVPLTNLRKSVSSMSIQKDCGTQTVDTCDDLFLKDSIIRYPSASTQRSSSSVRPQSAHHSHRTPAATCSKGHLMEPEEIPRYKSNFHGGRSDEHSEKMDRHISNLCEFMDRGSISKKHPQSAHHSHEPPATCSKGHLMEPEEIPRYKSNFHGGRSDEHSEKMDRQNSNLCEFMDRGSISKKHPQSILKNSSIQKSNKDFINEYQQREERTIRKRPDEGLKTIDISDDEDDHQNEMFAPTEKELGAGDARQRQLKAAEADPDCPEGHVPLSENERLEALKIAKKRFKDLVDDLNRLPMTSETLRVKYRKIEIEKKLNGLETNIRVFSRTKVYVKLD